MGSKSSRLSAIKQAKKSIKAQAERALIPAKVDVPTWRDKTRVKLLSKNNAAERRIEGMLIDLRMRFNQEAPIQVKKKEYFADFMIMGVRGSKGSMKLVLEIDGGYHFTPDQALLDDKRNNEMLSSFRVSRILRISSKVAMGITKNQLHAAIVGCRVGSVSCMYE